MGIPPSTWDGLSFTSKGELTWGTVSCTYWLPYSLHQIGDALYVLTAQSIDAALVSNPKLDLLRPFTAEYSEVGSVQVRKIIHLSALYVGIFLERDLMPAEAWICLWESIIDTGAKVGCLPIINWLWVALMRKSRYDQPPPPPPPAMPQPTAPLMDREWIWHHHHKLIRQLPGCNTALQCVQGLLIAMHIREVAVELQPGREEKAQVGERSKSKGLPEFLGKNLTYLLCLGQVEEHASLPPVWKALDDAPKKHHLTTLQCIWWHSNTDECPLTYHL